MLRKFLNVGKGEIDKLLRKFTYLPALNDPTLQRKR